MRTLRLLCILLLACLLAGAQQTPDAGGLSPKAGAVSENLYTNIFFGFNFRLPPDWVVSFVASEGPCAPECMLLEVRAPEFPKLPRSITISAEAASAARSDHLASAALIMEQSGARKITPLKEIVAGPRKFYRADYRSTLLKNELYQAFIAMPDKNYLVVFAFAAETRKQLDALADELTKNLTFVGGAKSSSQ